VFKQSPDFRGFVVSDRTKPTLETPFVDSYRLHSQESAWATLFWVSAVLDVLCRATVSTHTLWDSSMSK